MNYETNQFVKKYFNKLKIETNKLKINTNKLKIVTNKLRIEKNRGNESILVPAFNVLLAKLTKIKTGNEDSYVKKENNSEMIVELVLFLQYYVPDFFLYLIKSKEDISTKESVKKANKEFVEIIKKSKKIAHRLQMLEQLKSNNYQYLLQLLISQKNGDL